MKNLLDKEQQRLWKEGVVSIPDENNDMKMIAAHFDAKVYDEPSDYGIDCGRISKLQIRIDNEVVCNYDRGWDIEPTTKEARIAFQILVLDYN